MSIINISSADANAIDRISHSDFQIQFKKPLNDVVGFTVLEAVIPFTWYPVYNCAVSIQYQKSGSNKSAIVTIPDGYYNPTTFVDAWNLHFTIPEADGYTSNVPAITLSYKADTNRFHMKNTLNLKPVWLYPNHPNTTPYFRYVSGVERSNVLHYEFGHTNDDIEPERVKMDVDLEIPPRFDGPDILYLITDIILDSQNSKSYGGQRVMLPVNCNPLEIVHYSVYDTEETVPFSFYQDLNHMRMQIFDPITMKVIPDPGHAVYFRLKFHFRH